MNRMHEDTSSRPGLASDVRPHARRGRILALASLLAVTPMVTGFPQISFETRAHPVKSHIRHLGFVKSSVASMRAAHRATRSAPSTPGKPDPITTARAGAVTPVQAVSGAVTVVGVTWPRGEVTANDQFQIRTLTGGTWSDWHLLDTEEADGPDPAEAATATRGTSPYVITGASNFEVRSLTADPTAPTAATVQVVDPGTSDADSNQAPGSAPGAAAAATARPVIYPRSSWGANESLRREAPAYGRVQVGFVHHTVSPNSYTASQVPAMIRGIYAYHVQGQGWNDIGYNFLVDRFGRTWEGRFGGVDRPVVGAQISNYNSVSMGVSAIGNFDVAGVPSAVTAAYKRIFAWKFSLSGIPATGTVVANGKSFQRVSGHRDGFQTACPGRYLYARIPEIRVGAAALIAAQPPSVIKRDVDRNGAADALSYTPNGTSISGVSVLVSASRNPVRSGVMIGTGWNGLRNATLSPDLTGDGKADVIAQDPKGNRLRIYRGDGKGGFAGVLYRGTGWNAMTRLIAAGDRNGDGHNDLLATKSNGELSFYAGNGAGSFYLGRLIGTGWHKMSSVTSTGDLNSDGKPDLIATRKSDGFQYMFPGRADGSLSGSVKWGGGWGSFSPVIGGSDLDGDRYPDLFARKGGQMSTYSTGSNGRIVRYIRWGSGWGSMSQLSTGADWNGDGVADLLAVKSATSRGAMMLYAGTGRRDFLTRPGAFPTVAGADLVRLVGDVNGDGYTDAIARVRTNGTLVILLGMSGSRFAAPRTVGAGWNTFSLVEAAGDHDNDGVPDVLARDAAGGLFVYPFTRSLTLKARVPIGSGFKGMLSVVGAGAFDQGAYGDVVALRSDHALLLFRGSGPNPLAGGSVLKTGQHDLVQILGVGDYNGDRTADVMARASDGRLWLYPGNGKGALANRQPVRGGEGAGHVLG